jgi:hypothetical protein
LWVIDERHAVPCLRRVRLLAGAGVPPRS